MNTTISAQCAASLNTQTTTAAMTAGKPHYYNLKKYIMPNYVYNTIIIAEPIDSEKLKEIAKVGLCQYYRPMPEYLKGTKSPSDTPNWYDWAYENWNTKWGSFDNELEDDFKYDFSTAWSPPSDDIIEMFARDFPNFEYIWEEEQGFGYKFEYENGQIISTHKWDLPEWEPTKNDEITFLTENYTDFDHNTYEKGYYREYGIHEYLGKTINEAIENL